MRGVDIAIFCSFTREQMVDDFIARLKKTYHETPSTDLCFVIDTNLPNAKAKLKEYGRRFGYRSTSVIMNADHQVRHHDVGYRRRRIAQVKEQGKELIAATKARYVIGLEDDTVLEPDTLVKLFEQYQAKEKKQKVGFVEGVQCGRWNIKIIGAWHVDNRSCYTIRRPENPESRMSPIVGGGFYCYITTRDLYTDHEYKWHETPWGPDVEFGLQLTQKGYTNYIDWHNPVGHQLETGEILYPDEGLETVRWRKEGPNWVRVK